MEILVLLVPCIGVAGEAEQAQSLRSQMQYNSQGALVRIVIFLPVCLLCELIQCLFCQTPVNSSGPEPEGTVRQMSADVQWLAELVREFMTSSDED